MAAILGIKSGSTFSNSIQNIEVTYDFALDGGAEGVLDLFTASQDMVVHRVIAKVITACVGFLPGDPEAMPDPIPDAPATVAIGITGTADAMMTATGTDVLLAGVVVDSIKGGVKLASGGKIKQTIAVAALTAGKIRYSIEYSKF